MRRLGLRSRAGETPAQPSQARRSRDAGPTRPDRPLRGRVTPASRRAPCRRARCRRSFPCDGWRQRRARGHAEHPAKRPKHAPRVGRGGEQGGNSGIGQQVLKLPAITCRLRDQPDQPGKPAGQPGGQPLARAGRPGAGRTRPGDAARRQRPGVGPSGEAGETGRHAAQPAPDQHQQRRQRPVRHSLRRHRPAQPRDDRREPAGQRRHGERRRASREQNKNTTHARCQWLQFSVSLERRPFDAVPVDHGTPKIIAAVQREH